jgi:hypothetical protein
MHVHTDIRARLLYVSQSSCMHLRTLVCFLCKALQAEMYLCSIHRISSVVEAAIPPTICTNTAILVSYTSMCTSLAYALIRMHVYMRVHMRIHRHTKSRGPTPLQHYEQPLGILSHEIQILMFLHAYTWHTCTHIDTDAQRIHDSPLHADQGSSQALSG